MRLRPKADVKLPCGGDILTVLAWGPAAGNCDWTPREHDQILGHLDAHDPASAAWWRAGRERWERFQRDHPELSREAAWRQFDRLENTL